MTENAVQDMEGDEDVTRQRLLRRIAMAGVLIVALVASLAIFDAMFVNPQEPAVEEAPPAPVASVSVPPLEERGLDPAAETPAEAPPVPPLPPIVATPEPATKAEAGKPEASKPEASKPEANKSEASKPAAKGKAETKPITQPETKAPTKPAAAVPEGTGAPAVPAPPSAPLPKQAQAQAQARPQAASTPPATPAKPLAPGYLVQMGVFSNIANAEELKTRLDKAGSSTLRHWQYC